jgi:hypothetical protein
MVEEEEFTFLANSSKLRFSFLRYCINFIALTFSHLKGRVNREPDAAGRHSHSVGPNGGRFHLLTHGGLRVSRETSPQRDCILDPPKGNCSKLIRFLN